MGPLPEIAGQFFPSKFPKAPLRAFFFTKRRKHELDEIRTASDPTPEVFTHEKLCDLTNDSNSETVQISQAATTKFLADEDLPISDDYVLNLKAKDGTRRFEQNYFVVTTPVNKF